MDPSAVDGFQNSEYEAEPNTRKADKDLMKFKENYMPKRNTLRSTGNFFWRKKKKKWNTGGPFEFTSKFGKKLCIQKHKITAAINWKKEDPTATPYRWDPKAENVTKRSIFGRQQPIKSIHTKNDAQFNSKKTIKCSQVQIQRKENCHPMQRKTIPILFLLQKPVSQKYILQESTWPIRRKRKRK